MIKITYIVTDLSTGGAQTILYRLLSRLDKRFCPSVISLMDRGKLGESIESLGIPVYILGMNQGTLPTPFKIKRLIDLVYRLQPDLLQGWMYHGNLAAQLARTLACPQKPVVWSIHFSIQSLALEKPLTASVIKLGSVVSKFSSKILYVSLASQIQHEALGYCEIKSEVIPNGFETSLFKPSTDARLAILAELGIPKESYLIGLIGRYHPMKDHKNFFQAASLLREKQKNVHFILAGSEVDNNNQDLRELVSNLSLCDRVHLLGERSDMPQLTAALDIASLSSAYGEAFPLVIGEAMSCGIPCVVTDVGDSAWMVGSTGLVVSSKNPKALANAWNELINLGSEGRKSLGKAARRRIIELFSLEIIVEKYQQLYDKLFLDIK